MIQTKNLRRIVRIVGEAVAAQRGAILAVGVHRTSVHGRPPLQINELLSNG